MTNEEINKLVAAKKTFFGQYLTGEFAVGACFSRIAAQDPVAQWNEWAGVFGGDVPESAFDDPTSARQNCENMKEAFIDGRYYIPDEVKSSRRIRFREFT